MAASANSRYDQNGFSSILNQILIHFLPAILQSFTKSLNLYHKIVNFFVTLISRKNWQFCCHPWFPYKIVSFFVTLLFLMSRSIGSKAHVV